RGGGDVLQGDELANAEGLSQFDPTLADLERLEPVSERFLVAREASSSIAAVIIELREVGGRSAFWRRLVGIGLELGKLRRIGSFLVENRSDVGNGAWRRDERCLDGTGSFRHFGGIAFRHPGRRLAGHRALRLAPYTVVNDRGDGTTARGQIRFPVAAAALALHASMNLRTHGFPARFHDLLEAAGPCRLEQHNCKHHGPGQRGGHGTEAVARGHENPRLSRRRRRSEITADFYSGSPASPREAGPQGGADRDRPWDLAGKYPDYPPSTRRSHLRAAS